MFTTKLFRSVTPFINHKADELLFDDFDSFADYPATDPVAGSWGTIGFAQPSPNEYVIDLQGAGTLCLIQLNTRNLPGKTRDEKVAELVSAIEEREGRKVSRREYAELRSEAELILLPKAFIRRTFVPVIFSKGFIYVFTSSTKRCQDVFGLLFRALRPTGDKLTIHNLDTSVKQPVGPLLKLIAIEGSSEFMDTDEMYGEFRSGTEAALRGADREVIRIKDRSIASAEVQEVVKLDKYAVTKIGVEYVEQGSTDISAKFVLSDKLVITGLQQEGVKTDKPKDAQEAFDQAFNCAWLTVQNCVSITNSLIGLLDGLRPFQAEKKSSEPTDSDDGEM